MKPNKKIVYIPVKVENERVPEYTLVIVSCDEEGELLFDADFPSFQQTKPTIYYDATTIVQVVMWLYEEHKIWITLYPYDEFREDIFSYILLKRSGNIRDKFPYQSPSEVYEAAIEYCLNNLI